MKRLSLYLFLILFTLHTPSLADDIRDFEIEGISIGDSLLDHFSEEKIKKTKKTYYPGNDRFFRINIKKPNMEIYESLQFHLKDNDKNYKVYSISGLIFFREKKENINECNKIKKEIVNEIKNLAKNTKMDDEGVKKYKRDKSGKSKHNTVYFDFISGDYIKVGCVDYSNEFSEKMGGWYDNLRVSVNFKEYSDWLQDEAFK